MAVTQMETCTRKMFLLGNRRPLNKCKFTGFKVADVEIPLSAQIRSLGVLFDLGLSCEENFICGIYSFGTPRNRQKVLETPQIHTSESINFSKL
jgi:hypothetical protein